MDFAAPSSFSSCQLEFSDYQDPAQKESDHESTAQYCSGATTCAKEVIQSPIGSVSIYLRDDSSSKQERFKLEGR